jgi:hypothetical protein
VSLPHKLLALVGATIALSVAGASAAAAAPRPAHLTPGQRNDLESIAARTWSFYSLDVDPNTSLPRDYVSDVSGPPPGNYTSPTDIGMYLWSIVAARDLRLIKEPEARDRLDAALAAIEHLRKWNGFLLSWYDTTTANPITGPGGSQIGPGDSLTGQFISNVDNGWYASALVVVRRAFPQFRDRATSLLDAMDFAIFYDNGDQSTNITAGQMYGGYYANQGPAGFHYGVLNTETRISAYVGIGTRQMPGDVWWRTWRTLPASFDWQTQPPQGPTVTIHDPQSGKAFDVVEGHYSYGGVDYVPSWGGSEFEGLMPNLVVPETKWGQTSFGANDRNYALAEIAYVHNALNYPVWGLSPASTPDDTGGYDAFGAHQLSSNANCCPYSENAVTPHASFLALTVAPQEAYANIVALRDQYAVYGPHGFYDSVNPVTGSVAHRYLVLDQTMIMAALDEVLNHGGLTRYYGADPVGRAARAYLGGETFSIFG